MRVYPYGMDRWMDACVYVMQACTYPCICTYACIYPCLCVCISTYICMHAYTLCTHMHIYIFTRRHTHMHHMYVCVHACMYMHGMCVHECMHAFMCLCIYFYVCVCVFYIQEYMYVHIYIHCQRNFHLLASEPFGFGGESTLANLHSYLLGLADFHLPLALEILHENSHANFTTSFSLRAK
jgi:hypothetical protein